MTEEDRIERLVCEHGRMLVRLAASRLDSVADAEDAVQDVFCTLVSKKLVFVDPEHEKAWLIRATINRASDLRRRKSRLNVPLDEARAVPDDAAETERREPFPRNTPSCFTFTTMKAMACAKSATCFKCLQPRWARGWRVVVRG